MTQTTTVNTKTIQLLRTRVDKLTRELEAIKKKLFEITNKEPPYGSDEWWEWSDKKALEEIKAGKGLRFKSAKEAIKWLNS